MNANTDNSQNQNTNSNENTENLDNDNVNMNNNTDGITTDTIIDIVYDSVAASLKGK